MKNIINYITYKFNFIKFFFYVNVVPIKLLFDFTIKTEIEFMQKYNYLLYKIIKCSLYRMTPSTVSHKKNIIYFANHRTFADFSIDSVVVYNTGTFISRYLIALVIPGGNLLQFITGYLEFFNRKQGKTDINQFENMLKRIQDTDRNIIIYPEGTRRHGCDYACDLKKGSIYYSYKNDSPIQFVITHGKDDILNEKKLIGMPNVNAFVHYSKVYDQDYEKYKSMEEWYQYINSEWKTFFNTIYSKEHKTEDAFEKIDPNIVYDDNGKRRPMNKKRLYLARVAVVSIVSVSFFCISKLANFITTTLF
jgi:1-acyl-sn-glycerol-3-phosphate acyltransferase